MQSRINSALRMFRYATAGDCATNLKKAKIEDSGNDPQEGRRECKTQMRFGVNLRTGMLTNVLDLHTTNC